jgi:DNA-binding PadR family transcriptional regulator
MDVKSIILGFLMCKGMTGYELKKFFSISFSFFSGLSYGAIYPALRKMAEEGLITMELQIQDGTPNKKVYTITEKGKQVFLKSLKAPMPFEKQRSPFLIRLFFFAHLSPEERIENAKQYLGSVEKVRASLEAIRREVETHADPFQLLCFEFGVRFHRDLARNLSEIIPALEHSELKTRKAAREKRHGKAW